MTYVTTRKIYSRDETLIDCRALAADLALQLGGELDAERYESPADNRGLFVMPDGLQILVSTLPGNQPTRAGVSASPPTAWTRFLGTQSGLPYRLGECTVSGERDLPAIARDVLRKVVAPSESGLLRWRESFENWTATTDAAYALADELTASFPGVRFYAGDRFRREHEARSPTNRVTFSSHQGRPSFDGYISIGGGVTFERVSLGEAAGLALLAQLAKRET